MVFICQFCSVKLGGKNLEKPNFSNIVPKILT